MKAAVSFRKRSQRANGVIVGAGPAGLGMARVLRDLAIPDVRIFERDQIGSSFRQWPSAMRFISSSFPGNAFGLTHLNAVSFDSCPTFALELDVALIERLVAERDAARAAHAFVEADHIREQLVAIGVVIEDRGDRTRWRRTS